MIAYRYFFAAPLAFLASTFLCFAVAAATWSRDDA